MDHLKKKLTDVVQDVFLIMQAHAEERANYHSPKEKRFVESLSEMELQAKIVGVLAELDAFLETMGQSENAILHAAEFISKTVMESMLLGMGITNIGR
ncbi:uncharacterized protein LOC135491289 isoform X2 [Lineus longissimus]